MKPEQEQYILKNIGRQSVAMIAKDLEIKKRKIKRFLKQQQKNEKHTRTAFRASSKIDGCFPEYHPLPVNSQCIQPCMVRPVFQRDFRTVGSAVQLPGTHIDAEGS